MGMYLVHLELDKIIEAQSAHEAEKIFIDNIDFCLSPAPDEIICEAIPYSEEVDTNDK